MQPSKPTPTFLVWTLAAAAAVLGVPASPGAIIEWPIASGGNGHYYEPIPQSEGKSYMDAMLHAWQKGGQLVHIESADENAFVFGLISAPEYWADVPDAIYQGAYHLFHQGPLLGGYRYGLASDSPFHWIDWDDVGGSGTPTPTSQVPLGYANWFPGLPDPSLGPFMMFLNIDSADPSPTWGNMPSHIVSSYVIEYVSRPGSTVPDPAGSSLWGLCGAIAAGVVAFRRR